LRNAYENMILAYVISYGVVWGQVKVNS